MKMNILFLTFIFSYLSLQATKITQDSYTNDLQIYIKRMLIGEQGDCHADNIFDSEKLQMVSHLYQMISINRDFKDRYKKSWGQECIQSYRQLAGDVVREYEKVIPLSHQIKREVVLLLSVFLWQKGHTKKTKERYCWS